jgi:beta-lactamase class A
MLKALQRFLLMLLLLMGGLFLLYQGFLYLSVRHNMPSGMVIAGVDVGKLSAEETAVALEKRYYTPLRLTYRQETVELDPRLVGFTLDLETMMAEAQSYIEAQDPWQGYLRFLLGQSIMEPITIELRASHDRKPSVSGCIPSRLSWTNRLSPRASTRQPRLLRWVGLATIPTSKPASR